MYKLNTPEFLEDLRRENLYIKHGDITKIYSKELRYGFFIDIFSFGIYGDKVVFSAESNRSYWPNEYFYKEEIFPLVLYDFGSNTIMSVQNPVPYFERFYGKNWMIPIKDHNHSSEIGM